MQTPAYVIGIDFGSLSARALLCDVRDGGVAAECACDYEHGVLSAALPDGTPLPPDWALQHPRDYLTALRDCVRGALRQSGVAPARVVGLALDFTGSTPLPLGRDGQPLCFDPAFAREPHAYVKLWKHHAAAREADELTALCRARDPQLLLRNGGRVSSEVFFAKLLQILHESPRVFAATDRFLEAGDWVTQCLTGECVRSLPMACNKAFYTPGAGYPAFLEDAFPALRGRLARLLSGRMCALTQTAGHLTPAMAETLGLCPGIPVAAPQFDGHAALPALGIHGAEAAMLTVGTSSALVLAHPRFIAVEGAAGVNPEGTLPGLYGYGAGQASMGDTLAWFVERCAPPEVHETARARGVSAHQLLSERAQRLRIGQSGLLSLDWWNGNRSVLSDPQLSGLLLGLTLQTRPEEIYRALLEGLAFGLRRILASFEQAGIPIRTLHLAGGIAQKNPFFMQMLSDVTRTRLRASRPVTAAAVGAALFAAVAAGAYPALDEAIDHMNCLSGDLEYRPDEAAARRYDPLYSEYLALHDYFGRGANDVMKRLRALRQEETP